MLTFYVMTGRQSRNGADDKAVVCADYARSWVRTALERDYKLVQGPLPVEAHWSAQVLPSREFSDWDQRTEEA